MKITTTITSGELVEGTYVEGASVGRTKAGRISFTAAWAGVFDGIRPDTHDGKEDYAYFRDGHINGVAQGIHGFPVTQIATDSAGSGEPAGTGGIDPSSALGNAGDGHLVDPKEEQ